MVLARINDYNDSEFLIPLFLLYLLVGILLLGNIFSSLFLYQFKNILIYTINITYSINKYKCNI